MRIVMTGGAGFLGRKLAAALLARGALTDARGAKRAIERLTLVDVVAAAGRSPTRACARSPATSPTRRSSTRALEGGADTRVPSCRRRQRRGRERTSTSAWRVNVDATRALLERCRALARRRSSCSRARCAVFGGPLPDPVRGQPGAAGRSRRTAMQKAVGEFLVYDFTRKGFIDGRSLRLPTISVRPGKPNKAASSFASGIMREPLERRRRDLPGERATTRMWLLSPRAVIANMIVGHEAPAAAFAHTRSINVPGISIPVSGMIDALRRVAGDAVADRVTWRHDPAIDRIVQTWPVNFDTVFGRSLGMAGDADFDSIVRQYIDDELPARVTAKSSRRCVTPQRRNRLDCGERLEKAARAPRREAASCRTGSAGSGARPSGRGRGRARGARSRAAARRARAVASRTERAPRITSARERAGRIVAEHARIRLREQATGRDRRRARASRRRPARARARSRPSRRSRRC